MNVLGLSLGSPVLARSQGLLLKGPVTHNLSVINHGQVNDTAKNVIIC